MRRPARPKVELDASVNHERLSGLDPTPESVGPLLVVDHRESSAPPRPIPQQGRRAIRRGIGYHDGTPDRVPLCAQEA
jgi:hypothetical protein